jgi:predicted transcriptional regulator
MSVNPGELHHTTRGIAEIKDFYTENGIQKVRFWLHVVEPEDGVTPTGDALLMSTTPDKLQAWIDRFPRDISERKRSVSAMKDMYPAERERVDGILARIKEAEAKGPSVKTKRKQ